jgi:hypothetical protein
VADKRRCWKLGAIGSIPSQRPEVKGFGSAASTWRRHLENNTDRVTETRVEGMNKESSCRFSSGSDRSLGPPHLPRHYVLGSFEVSARNSGGSVRFRPDDCFLGIIHPRESWEIGARNFYGCRISGRPEDRTSNTIRRFLSSIKAGTKPIVRSGPCAC